MTIDDCNLIVDEYKGLLKDSGVVVDESEIDMVARKSIDDANEKYTSLKAPRFMAQDNYVLHWLREELNKYLVSKTMMAVTQENTDPQAKALFSLFEVFGPKLQEEIISEISMVDSMEERRELWEKKNLPVREIEKRIKALACARNEKAREKKHDDFIHQIIVSHKISDGEFQKFVENVDSVIQYCNDNLPEIKKSVNFYSEYFQPCYLCNIKFPEINFPDGVVSFVSDKYPLLKEFESRLNITLGEKSGERYIKEDDTFRITIDSKQNTRHRSILLIHELSHVVNQIEEYQNGDEPLRVGKYLEEKKAVEMGIFLLKNISPEVYRAYLGDVLLLILRTIFEISIYKEQVENLSQTYAELFNRCFPEANQKENQFYLLDKAIISRPLASLSQTVALVNTIASELE